MIGQTLPKLVSDFVDRLNVIYPDVSPVRLVYLYGLQVDFGGGVPEGYYAVGDSLIFVRGAGLADKDLVFEEEDGAEVTITREEVELMACEVLCHEFAHHLQWEKDHQHFAKVPEVDFEAEAETMAREMFERVCADLGINDVEKEREA